MINEITKKDFQQFKEESKKDNSNFRKELKQDVNRYIKIVSEDFGSKLQPVIEMQQEQGNKIDANTEMIGKIKEDTKIIKADNKIIKSELKKKVNHSEHTSLENRVIVLEKSK